jgi:CheY-like chemotaxis protein
MEPRLYILMVEDDHTDLAMFGMAADKIDLDIWLQTATSAQQAIDYLEAKGVYADRSLHPLPDVIVVDSKLPQMKAFDFLDWRKASFIFSSIPVVVLTGSNDSAEAERIAKTGAKKLIVKPTEFEQWKRVVQEIWDFATEGTAFYRADQLRRKQPRQAR